MKQLEMFDVSNPTLDAAKDLIRTYVKRGDTLESLQRSYMGHSSPNGMYAQIGGYMNGVSCSNKQLLVMRDTNGQIVETVFSLKEIYGLVADE